MNEIPYGECHCGCRQKTAIARRNDCRRGHEKGKPLNFITGHNFATRTFQKRKISSDGYVLIYQPNHPRAKSKNRKGYYVFEHILICEKVLGRPLPLKAQTHHVDGDKTNNENRNLVICQDLAYHMLIERRTRAYKACGHGAWRKCCYCHQYDDPENLYISDRHQAFHRQCQNDYRAKKRAERQGCTP